ncbi:MAG: hypothetical protein IJN59_03590 [Oscillospiraceae bacterium]|nr:hypothetical protein [Oscillospiraceae bacterium]
MFKKTLCAALAVCMLLGLTACVSETGNVSDVAEKITQQSTTKAQLTTQPTTQEITTEAPKLSSSFDMILATGYENNGDYYEVVANETEDYVGTKVEIGIIKNNEWVLEPTTSMPFIDEDGTIYGKNLKSIYDMNVEDTTFGYGIYNNTILHLGNDCFLFYSNEDCMIYNAVTKQYYEMTIDISYGSQFYGHCNYLYESYFTYCRDFINISKLSKDNSKIISMCKAIWVASDVSAISVDILDTNTMEVSTIVVDGNWERVGVDKHWDCFTYPISENIFAIANDYEEITFYDADGNIVFENDFKLTGPKQTIVFKNGKCTFEIVNDAGNVYKITIDKQGNVIDSVKISD